MALLGGKRIHLVIGDSRVAGIGDIVTRKGGANEHVEFKLCKGATFSELAEVAEGHLQKCPFDVIYLAGGVCDLTCKDYFSGAIYFEWTDQLSLQYHLVNSLKSANERLKK